MMSLLAVLSGYLAANSVGIAVRVIPLTLLATLITIEWCTASVFQKFGLAVVAITSVVEGLEIAGKLPVVTAPKTSMAVSESSSAR